MVRTNACLKQGKTSALLRKESQDLAARESRMAKAFLPQRSTQEEYNGRLKPIFRNMQSNDANA